MMKKFSASEWQLVWLTLGFAAGLWLMSFLDLTSVIANQVNQSYLPFQKIIIFGVISAKIKLYQLNESWTAEQALVNLRAEQLKLTNELIELKSTRDENLALRKMVENSDRKLIKTIVTAPIISFAQPALGLGSDAGITPGMLVISQNHLLGFVTETKTTQALVTLLGQTQTQPVLAETITGVRGIVRGDGKQVWLLEVPPDQIVKEGEIVMSVGQTGVSPKLILGVVSKIETDLVLATQKIKLIQPISFYELPLVEVR